MNGTDYEGEIVTANGNDFVVREEAGDYEGEIVTANGNDFVVHEEADILPNDNDDDIVFENVGQNRNLRLRMPMPMNPVNKKLPKKSTNVNEKRGANFCDIELGGAFVATREPKTYMEALRSEDSENWKEAMDSEVRSLEKNQTWQLKQLPEGRKVIDNKWVFKVKKYANGQIERYKARLVIRGFTQEYGIDYEETFSPVVKFTSLRSIIAMAATERLHMKQFDVATAFLYGDLEEEIFMTQPQGYEDGSNRVCRLRKSLYGQSLEWEIYRILERFPIESNVVGPVCFCWKKGQQQNYSGTVYRRWNGRCYA